MPRFQFDIRAAFVVIFVASMAMAIVSQPHLFVSRILLTVLLANFAGVVTALVVTFVLKFPRDGGFRDQESESECGSVLQAVDDHEHPCVGCQSNNVAQAIAAVDD
jgi:hypothetical protein